MNGSSYFRCSASSVICAGQTSSSQPFVKLATLVDSSARLLHTLQVSRQTRLLAWLPMTINRSRNKPRNHYFSPGLAMLRSSHQALFAMPKALLLLLAATPAVADVGAVSVEVVDAVTRRPVDGVTITAESRDGEVRSATTDKGSALLDNLEDGFFRLRAESAGYVTAVEPAVRVLERTDRPSSLRTAAGVRLDRRDRRCRSSCTRGRSLRCRLEHIPGPRRAA